MAVVVEQPRRVAPTAALRTLQTQHPVGSVLTPMGEGVKHTDPACAQCTHGYLALTTQRAPGPWAPTPAHDERSRRRSQGSTPSRPVDPCASQPPGAGPASTEHLR